MAFDLKTFLFFSQNIFLRSHLSLPQTHPNVWQLLEVVVLVSTAGF